MTEKTNNTFVINDVINDLVDAEKSLINPLMKLNYFGRFTKNKELTEYTLKEIKGYSADSGRASHIVNGKFHFNQILFVNNQYFFTHLFRHKNF